MRAASISVVHRIRIAERAVQFRRGPLAFVRSTVHTPTGPAVHELRGPVSQQPQIHPQGVTPALGLPVARHP